MLYYLHIFSFAGSLVMKNVEGEEMIELAGQNLKEIVSSNLFGPVRAFHRTSINALSIIYGVLVTLWLCNSRYLWVIVFYSIYISYNEL